MRVPGVEGTSSVLLYVTEMDGIRTSSFGRIEPELLRDSIGIRIILSGFNSINVIYRIYIALSQRTALRMTLDSLILN